MFLLLLLRLLTTKLTATTLPPSPLLHNSASSVYVIRLSYSQSWLNLANLWMTTERGADCRHRGSISFVSRCYNGDISAVRMTSLRWGTKFITERERERAVAGAPLQRGNCASCQLRYIVSSSSSSSSSSSRGTETEACEW